jgi:hypothetical protein
VSACAAPACALVSGSCSGAPVTAARTIDGISDQSLPAWGGSFAQSALGALLTHRTGGPFAGVTMARYVVQWNAMSEPASTPRGNPSGDYRDRYEAWVSDVGAAGLTPVLALTSYDGSRPSGEEYAQALRALLARAAVLGHPIAYVEPWNEPDNQGHAPAAAAAAMADTANGLCQRTPACAVVAGDFEDNAGVLAYARAYAAALTFTPAIWGVHPYFALAERNDARLTELRAALRGSDPPAEGPDRAPQLWFTEIAVFECRGGRVQGAAAQLAEAEYLRSALLPALAPAHTFYYGVLFADRSAAPCAGPGGADPELYEPDESPRPAASAVLGDPLTGALGVFGPAPG